MISPRTHPIFQFPVEALLWLGGFVALAISDPTQDHFSICPLNSLGLDFCPGCGLGTSISFFLHGDVTASLKSHPLGIIAFVILTYRIIELTKNYLKTHGKSN